MTNVKQQTGSDQTAIRPFRVNFPDAELTELRRRIDATRWPERETITDESARSVGPVMPLRQLLCEGLAKRRVVGHAEF